MAPAAQRPRSLTLLNTHTGESLCAPYRLGEAFDADNLARFNVLLRDHRTGAIKAIDPPLFDILYDVAWRLGVDPHFEVISGYRSSAPRMPRSTSSAPAWRFTACTWTAKRSTCAWMA